MLRSVHKLVQRQAKWSLLTRSMATHELPVPSLGDSISDGTLVEFLKEPGQAVVADEIVAVIETDKVSIDIRSSFAGTVMSLLVNADDTVVVGQPLMMLDSDVAATVESSSSAPSAAPAPSAPSTPTPAPTPSPVAAAPTPAAATSSPTAAGGSSHGRKPRIRFRHGDRAAIDALFGHAGNDAPAALAATDEEFLALPFLYRRLPLTEEEMELINMGGASDESDVQIEMRYV